jgi:hypothetical protein
MVSHRRRAGDAYLKREREQQQGCSKAAMNPFHLRDIAMPICATILGAGDRCLVDRHAVAAALSAIQRQPGTAAQCLTGCIH